jgi:ribose transport system permease protein
MIVPASTTPSGTSSGPTSRTGAGRPAPGRGRVLVSRLRDLLPVLALTILLVGFSLASPFFLDPVNFRNLATDSATLMLCAFGMALVILLGEIDLSVGAVISLLSVGLAQVMLLGVPWPLAVLTILLAGAAVGLLNGVVTVVGRVPSFIVTLGAGGVAGGLAYVASGGIAVSVLDGQFLEQLYFATFAGLPIPLFVVAGAFVATHVLLRRTAFGAELRAIGTNPEAARLSGVAVARSRVLVFVLMGVLVALGAVLATARLGSGTPEVNPQVTLDAIAAVIIGGASLMGGRASIPRTLLGALLIAVLNNGMTLLNVNTYWQLVIKGVIILVAVLVDQAASRSRS